MNKKELWIHAYETTLKEYQEDRHEFNNCIKCQVNNKTRTRKNIIIGERCCFCPESIFEYNFAGCLERNAYAIQSHKVYEIPDGELRKAYVILYHEKAIEAFKTMKIWNLKKAQKILVEINKQF